MTATKVQYDAFAPEPPRDAIQLMRDIARQAGPSGCTIDDFRIKAAQQGAMDNVGYGREYAWLGGLARKAGLVSNGQRRRSIIPTCHGNWRVVWVAKEYA